MASSRVLDMPVRDTDHTTLADIGASPAGSTVNAPASGSPVEVLAVAPLPVVNPAHYEVGSEFSHGGAGRLLSARDLRLGRTVAIKQLHRRGARIEARFRREAEITARLEHPSIVPIHEAGTWPNGEPFYAMKLVSGRSLSEVIAATRTLDERMALIPNVLAVAEAMAYAHSQRIIHRDLKPANVLVGAFGETVVIDWGLAKDLSRSSDGDDDDQDSSPTPEPPELTKEGAVMGTPAYMPPEQALGRPVDERADVYAVGAMLYTVLCGRSPFRGESSEQVLARVVSGSRPPLERGVPGDLAAVVERAMARDPDARYPTAGELAEDLRRFLTGQLVRAHHYSSAVLLRRWLKQNRRPVLVGGVALLALAALAVTGVVRISREREAALIAEGRATLAQQTAESRRNQLLLAQARNSLDRDPTLALAWTKAFVAAAPPEAERRAVRTLAVEAEGRGLARHVLRDCTLSAASRGGATLALLRDGALVLASPDSAALRTVDAHPGSLRGLAVSDDGTWIAATDEHGLVIWDAATGERRLTSLLPDAGKQLAFAPDGRSVVVGQTQGTLLLVDLPGGGTRRLVGHTGAIRALVFSLDGRWLVSNSTDGTDRVWRRDAEHAHRLLPDALVEGGAALVDLSAQGDLIAWGGTDGGVRVADLATLTPRVLRGHRGLIYSVAFSPDGKSLASASLDRTVRVWNLASGTSQVLAGHTDEVRRVFFSPDGQLVASSSTDLTVRVWDVATGDPRALRGHDNQVNRLYFAPDSRHLVTAETGGQVRFWTVAPSPERVLRGHASIDIGVRLGAGGALLSYSYDATARVWDVRTGAARVLPTPVKGIGQWDASPDGLWIAAGGVDHSVFLLEVKSGVPRTLGRHSGTVIGVRFSPDGRTLATTGGDARQVRLWDVATGASRELAGHTAPVRFLAFSPDGTSLASGGEDAVARIWNVATGAELLALRGHERPITELAFSPDGGTLATVSADTTVRVWDRRTGSGRVLTGHTGLIESVHFSPDGKTVASAGDDRSARLWDLATGSSVVLPHDAIVGQVRFTHDGRRVVTCGADGTVRVWSSGGDEQSCLRGHTEIIEEMAIAADDSWVATSSQDSTIRVWPLGPPTPRATSSRQLLDELSSAALGPDDRPVTLR